MLSMTEHAGTVVVCRAIDAHQLGQHLHRWATKPCLCSTCSGRSHRLHNILSPDMNFKNSLWLGHKMTADEVMIMKAEDWFKKSRTIFDCCQTVARMHSSNFVPVDREKACRVSCKYYLFTPNHTLLNLWRPCAHIIDTHSNIQWENSWKYRLGQHT